MWEQSHATNFGVLKIKAIIGLIHEFQELANVHSSDITVQINGVFGQESDIITPDILDIFCGCYYSSFREIFYR